MLPVYGCKRELKHHAFYFQISRGSADPGKRSITSLKNHLQRKHSEEVKAAAATQDESVDVPEESPVNESRKRGSSTYTELFVLCPQKRRKDLFQKTIDDWREAKTMLHIDHPKAKRLHRSIFEMMIMDNLPFYAVSKPGFLRHHAIAVPNFQVASEKFYRSMLEPAYNSIR